MWIVKSEDYQLYVGELVQGEIKTHIEKEKAYQFKSKEDAELIAFAMLTTDSGKWIPERLELNPRISAS